MTMFNDIKDFYPWIVTALTGLFALKKDFILGQFTKTEKKLEVAHSRESVEAAGLENVERSMSIYRGMVEDLKSTIGDLKEEIIELKEFVEEQKIFIAKQQKSLTYYERTYGKINK